EKKEPTDSMIVGSAFHTLLLEPDLFQKEYIVSPKVDRRTTKGKEEWSQFLHSANGKMVITTEQHVQALKMANEAKKQSIVNTLLEASEFEQSIFWTDKETGIQFKARPDIWSQKVIVDVKTSADASHYAFQRSAIKYGY